MRRAIDRIQRRYGWTDEYVTRVLPYARLRQLMEDTARWEQEEIRERYRQQAFISWQSYNLLSSMFNKDAEPLTFGEYLNLLGLGEKTTAHLEEDVTKEQAIEKAKSILMLLKDGESHD
ncbi:hypothetical protein [Parageobacillus thermoglucosidasius]|uniref:hypothetical protein n=1 Tax=Parageobacillus thermoglucosidasius TaxID=1426 RepID=UPI002E1DC3F0|nr:hypothetical protein [Parageobacillus thermoglucosidasius]MED4946501.1 hypothetical protein [Parageobacillus thermoglucosidasius]MED4984062.1 hypothetical protein [Parageobacillus thermoglucosidasius]